MLDSLWESLPDSLADCDVDSDCDSEPLESESLWLLVDDFQLYEGALSDPDSLRDSLSDVLDSDWLDSDVEDSLVDDALSDADDCELLMDGVLADSLDCEVDESLDWESDELSDEPLD